MDAKVEDGVPVKQTHSVLWASSRTETVRQIHSVWDTLVCYFSQVSFWLPVLAGLLLAYGGELAEPTFHTDRFFEIWFRDNLLDYWTGYGRYFGKLLMLAMDSVYPPTFLLMIGLVILTCVGICLCQLWRVTGAARPILVLILCTFPFFFETFSYVPLRCVVPLAIALALSAVVKEGPIGFACALSALLLYQSSMNMAAVVVLVWALIELLHGRSWQSCVRTILLPKLALVISAVIIDAVALRVITTFLTPISLLDNSLVNSASAFRSSFETQLGAMAWFFVERDVFLFPVWTKIIALVGLCLVILGLFRRRLSSSDRIFAILLLLLLPFAAHGVSLLLAHPSKFLFERVLFAYSGIYTGIFALLLVLFPKGRACKLITIVAGLAAIGFIYQTVLWHDFMELKNMADIDMARAISDRLKANPNYAPNLPLVMVGTTTPTEYLPYRMYHPKQGEIQNSILDSAYAVDWSKDRMLMFFIPFAWPAQKQIDIATNNARFHAAWPAPDSTFISDGVMTVVLAK